MADLGDKLLSTWVALTRLAGPVGMGIVGVRRRRGKEDPARSGERLGRPSAIRPEGPLVWMHAVSVGEAMAALGADDIADGTLAALEPLAAVVFSVLLLGMTFGLVEIVGALLILTAVTILARK